MLTFLLRRSVAAVFTLFCVITITFFLIRLTPGSPFDSERKIPEHIEKQLLARYKLDGTLFQQYLGYLADVVRGDLRLSTKYADRTVNEILAQSLPASFLIGSIAFVIAAGGGVWLGVASAVRKESWLDRSAMLACLCAISLPMFITGPLAVLIFGLWLQWLPVGGWGTLTSLILPSLVLATPYLAYVARLARSGMLEVLGQDFVRTATAKGGSRRLIVYGHALRVAILPVVSFLGPLAAHLLTGSIVVETVFNIPGVGPFFVNSILNKDSFLLGGVVIVYCALLVLMNLLVDITYSVLDRRIQIDG